MITKSKTISRNTLILRVLLALSSLVAAGWNAGIAREQTVQDRCTSLMNLTNEEKEAVGIRQVEWKTSDGIVNTPHCKILMAAGAGEFSSTGLLLDSVPNFPSAGILRVPTCYDGSRALFFRPGASFDLTAALGPAAQFMRPPECMAVMNLWYPTFATYPGHPEDFFSTPSRYPQDLQKSLSVMMHLGRDVLSSYFLDSLFYYYHGGSLGAVAGLRIAEISSLTWIDGWVFQAAGGGQPQEGLRRIWSCLQDPSQPPVSKLTNVTYNFSCTGRSLAGEIGLWLGDYRYRDEILDILDTVGESDALQHALAYDLGERPQSVQIGAELPIRRETYRQGQSLLRG